MLRRQRQEGAAARLQRDGGCPGALCVGGSGQHHERTHLPIGGNPIEAVAQDEAVFQANADLLFSKGVVVQTGNSVSTKIELGLGVNAGLSSEKGSSANVGVQIGVSQTTQSETGAAADLLNCRGVACRYCPPVSLELAASGKAQINASHRTVGIAEATTQAQGLGYVAASDCPGAGVVYRGWIRTRPLLFHDTRRDLTQFLETRSGLQINWGPWMEVERRP